MIVLDLEFNSGMYGPQILDEILQIGAVKVDGLGGAVTGAFNAFIKPRVHKRLSPGARVLPELSESLERGIPFEEAYSDWLSFIDGETEFAEWGRDDFKILCRNALYFGLEPVLPGTYIDVQTAFSRELGASNAAQLYQAAEYCRIPDTFVFHNALHDALYVGDGAGGVYLWASPGGCHAPAPTHAEKGTGQDGTVPYPGAGAQQHGLPPGRVPGVPGGGTGGQLAHPGRQGLLRRGGLPAPRAGDPAAEAGGRRRGKLLDL